MQALPRGSFLNNRAEQHQAGAKPGRPTREGEGGRGEMRTATAATLRQKRMLVSGVAAGAAAAAVGATGAFGSSDYTARTVAGSWSGTRLATGSWRQTKPANASMPSAGAFKFGYFKTPSGNIQCDYGYRGAADANAFVRCGIRSGLKPPPPSRGPGCQVPDRVTTGHTGHARLAGPSWCPGEDEGDAGPFAGGQPGGPPVPVLNYGKTWHGGGIRCTSALSGLTCRNKSGHGFFLSRAIWRRF
jgi:Family of unknown function (DUF6636)